MLDVAVLVPFQSARSSWVDSTVRAALAPTRLVVIRARDRLLELLGASLPAESSPSAHRSLTAIVLATSLERAGLTWRVLDPGVVALEAWRSELERLRRERPRVVAVSSTFVNDGFWLGSLCALVRRALPDARVVVGGYYYAADAEQFLSLDADVFCVGEGERRIVEIVEAIRDGGELGAIPGLYLRKADGRLHYTGDVEPLRLDELPLPDWSLSTRIDPPVDPEQQELEYRVETQRGCVFRCEFCTFRTLAAPAVSSDERAAVAIRDVATRGHGMIYVVDATATSPRARWLRVLERLIELGGSPAPISIYARVSDLDDEVCEKMWRAGVRYVYIGQESGDQKLLNEMRKGTRVEQVRPAIAALGRHGIAASVCVIYGFPGETERSLENTRRLIATINDGHESRPVVHGVNVFLFNVYSLAAVSRRDPLEGVHHQFGWSHLEITPARAAEAQLETFIELAGIPHAPYTAFRLEGLWAMYRAPSLPVHDETGDFFRWAKACDRALAVFAEHELTGKHPGRAELVRLREQILSGIAPDCLRASSFHRGLARVRHRATWRLLEEWGKTNGERVGPLTRLALGHEVGRATGSFSEAYRALRTGRYPALGFVAPSERAEGRGADAEQLIRLGIATGTRRLPTAAR